MALDHSYQLLLTACVAFFVGILLILLIMVIVAGVLWKCGLRLEKRGNSPREEENVGRAEPTEPPAPHEAEEGVGGTVTETRRSSARPRCSHCSRSIRTSSGRPSFLMRSRKANSDPMHYSQLLHRRARCVSLGTELQHRKRKFSDPIDFMAPYFERRRGSMWTRVSADDSIVYENDYVIVISRDRQKTTPLCQLCGQKKPTPPPPARQSRSSEPCTSTAPHGSLITAQRPTNNSLPHSRPANYEGTSQEKPETSGRVQHASRECDIQKGFVRGNVDPLNGCIVDSGLEEIQETLSSDGNDQRHLSMASELWLEENLEGAGSDQSVDKPPDSISNHPFIGHAVTSTTTKTFIVGSSYRSRYNGKQD